MRPLYLLTILLWWSCQHRVFGIRVKSEPISKPVRVSDLDSDSRYALQDLLPNMDINDIARRLNPHLEVQVCPKWSCEDPSRSPKPAGKKFHQFICVPCPSGGLCSLGYYRYNSCICGEATDQNNKNKVNWELQSNALCMQDDLPRRYFNKRPDKVPILLGRKNFTIEICANRACGENFFLHASRKEIYMKEDFGNGIIAEWWNQRCDCVPGRRQPVSDPAEEFRLTITSCTGRKDVTLKTIYSKGINVEECKQTTTTHNIHIRSTSEENENNTSLDMETTPSFDTPSALLSTPVTVTIIFIPIIFVIVITVIAFIKCRSRVLPAYTNIPLA